MTALTFFHSLTSLENSCIIDKFKFHPSYLFNPFFYYLLTVLSVEHLPTHPLSNQFFINTEGQ